MLTAPLVAARKRKRQVLEHMASNAELRGQYGLTLRRREQGGNSINYLLSHRLPRFTVLRMPPLERQRICTSPASTTMLVIQRGRPSSCSGSCSVCPALKPSTSPLRSCCALLSFDACSSSLACLLCPQMCSTSPRWRRLHLKATGRVAESSRTTCCRACHSLCRLGEPRLHPRSACSNDSDV